MSFGEVSYTFKKFIESTALFRIEHSGNYLVRAVKKMSPHRELWGRLRLLKTVVWKN